MNIIEERKYVKKCSFNQINPEVKAWVLENGCTIEENDNVYGFYGYAIHFYDGEFALMFALKCKRRALCIDWA